MKTSAIVCALLAGSLGFGSLASAQEWGGGRSRGPGAQERHDRHDGRGDRRHDRWEGRRDGRGHVQPAPSGRRHAPPAYVYSAPRGYGWDRPVYGAYAPRFQRGGYLPYEYRQGPYYVSDWRAYPGLYAPPYGHQWVRVGSDFMLVALATGLIANLLLQ